MPTIPDRVLDQLIEHRPHLAQLVANVRAAGDDDALVAQLERSLATAYLLGETHLSAQDTWHLSQVAHGGPWGGDWLSTSHAAALLDVTDSRIRQRISAEKLPHIKRGKTLYVWRDGFGVRTNSLSRWHGRSGARASECHEDRELATDHDPASGWKRD
jgi:hypothetical protein